MPNPGQPSSCLEQAVFSTSLQLVLPFLWQPLSLLSFWLFFKCCHTLILLYISMDFQPTADCHNNFIVIVLMKINVTPVTFQYHTWYLFCCLHKDKTQLLLKKKSFVLETANKSIYRSRMTSDHMTPLNQYNSSCHVISLFDNNSRFHTIQGLS